jgi:hypothetical protein
MAKKYKISRKNLNEFFSFFGNKQTPDEIRKIIDNDPILKKLDKDIGDINDKAGERMKRTLPAKTLAMLKKYGLY